MLITEREVQFDTYSSTTPRCPRYKGPGVIQCEKIDECHEICAVVTLTIAGDVLNPEPWYGGWFEKEAE